jgi:hypothetical protein
LLRDAAFSGLQGWKGKVDAAYTCLGSYTQARTSLPGASPFAHGKIGMFRASHRHPEAGPDPTGLTTDQRPMDRTPRGHYRLIATVHCRLFRNKALSGC